MIAPPEPRDFDTLVVGAGIAGSSLAWRLAQAGHRVLLLEAEDHAGRHSTGRSAAMFMESYGSPQARALTRASRHFYLHPPDGFSPVPLVSPRGVIYAAWDDQQPRLDELHRELTATGSTVHRLDAAATLRLAPVLRRQGLLGALHEPDAMDIDVDALHQAWLRGARRLGVELRLSSGLLRAEASPGGWAVQTADGRRVNARTLVNAAGAWADEVARRCGVAPLGIQPRRRSAFIFDGPADEDFRAWPTMCGVCEDWYLKPDAGQLLGSPANADPVPAHDVQPEELDIAMGIAAIERDTQLRIRRPRRTWAGLRSFAPDDELVIGPDAAEPGFFWLAGQGGYGIQSAAGASLLAASLLTGSAPPTALRAQGVDAAALSPGRFSTA